MGCWGITAFESDAGLDAVGFIRKNLPEDGKLELGKIMDALRQDAWNAPPDVTDVHSHTSPMALAEILVKFLEQDFSELDYDGQWAEKDKKFSDLTSFTASKESLRQLQEYLSDTMQSCKEYAAENKNWCGWFKEKDWIGWQGHMENLVSRLDTLLASAETSVELVPQEPEQTQNMGQRLC